MKKICLALLISIGTLSATDSTLHVNGTGKVWIKATLADVRLGIEVEGKTSTQVQNDLARAMNSATAALKKMAPPRLETSSFNTFPEYSDQTPHQIKGYRGNGEIVITVPSEKAGEIIGLAMDSGITKVNGIELKASPDEIAEANKKAIKEACANALESANVALDALGLTLDEITDVNLNPQEPVFRPFRAAVAFNAMEKGSTGPQVEGEQVVQSDVALQIRFKSKN